MIKAHHNDLTAQPSYNQFAVHGRSTIVSASRQSLTKSKSHPTPQHAMMVSLPNTNEDKNKNKNSGSTLHYGSNFAFNRAAWKQVTSVAS